MAEEEKKSMESQFHFNIYVSIIKPRIVALIAFVATVTAIIPQGGLPPLNRLMLLLAAVGLASMGATALNHYLDRDIDSLMRRTRNRPLPSGTIKRPYWVLIGGLALVTLSLSLSLRLNYQVALYNTLGAFFYVVIYTWWLKRRSHWNIVIGGLAGSCAALAGWFSATNNISAVPVLIALILFLWTPSHFWSFALVQKDDYRRAGIPMLPLVVGDRATAHHILVYTALSFLASILLFILGPFSTKYLLVAILLGAWFLTWNIRLILNPSPRLAWSNYKLSGIYLLGLFLTMALDLTLG
ncbi:MAG: heme o synthase [Thermodesulfobacteriota bacterium]